MKNVASIIFCLIMAVHSAWVESAEHPWYTRMLVGMEVGPTGAQFGYSDATDERYCRHFDGREIVRNCIAAHAEYLVMWVRDGDYAYYNSMLLPKAPGLGDRDPLQEAMDEANFPVIAYCVVQQGGHYLQEHPEFEMRDINGAPIGRFCFNSGYLEKMKEIVAEQLAYGIAGFHMDMLDQGFGPPYGCWCEHCRKKFESTYGHALPTSISWDESWDHFLEFRYQSSETFEKELTRFIKSINPLATVDYNYHGNPPFSFEVGQRPVQHAGNADFVTGETGVWGFSALTVGLNAAFYRAATPDYPVQVAMQRGVRMYHDQTTRPLEDMRWELFTLLAHGAFVTMVDKTGFDGALDPVAYERIGKAFAEARQKKSHFGQSFVQDVGIYFSQRTRDWVGKEQPHDYFTSFLGAHKAMAYSHISWGVLLDENIEPAFLQRYPVILLPNTGILTEKEGKLLEDYVIAGGNLIITGLSGCYDMLGHAKEHSALETLIGARYKGALDSLDNWVRLASDTPEALRESVPADWAFLVKGPAAVYEPRDAQSFGEVCRPFRTTRQLEGKEGTDWPMSAETPAGPALLINKIGKGLVLTFAVSPDYAAGSEHPVVEARQLLAGAVRFLYPNRRVQIAAPATVQTVVSDDPKSRLLRIHFLGYNAPPQTIPAKNRPYILPALIEEPPLYRATLQCMEPIASAVVLNPNTTLVHNENRIEVMINDIHEVVLLHY